MTGPAVVALSAGRSWWSADRQRHARQSPRYFEDEEENDVLLRKPPGTGGKSAR